jgi:hypothetical protein
MSISSVCRGDASRVWFASHKLRREYQHLSKITNMLAPVRFSIRQTLACTVAGAIDSSQGLVGTDHVATMGDLGIELDAFYVILLMIFKVSPRA